MIFSIAALLAIVQLAVASPASTYCYEDNLLRALQHTPTPAAQYCSSPTGYPTFLAIKSYDLTRFTSACSCFSRFPVEGATPTTTTSSTTSSAACTPTAFTFDAVPPATLFAIHLLITIDRTQPCGNLGGYTIVSICGTYGNGDASQNTHFGDGCYYPDTAPTVDSSGFAFATPAVQLYSNQLAYEIHDYEADHTDVVSGGFADVCKTNPACPVES